MRDPEAPFQANSHEGETQAGTERGLPRSHTVRQQPAALGGHSWFSVSGQRAKLKDSPPKSGS